MSNDSEEERQNALAYSGKPVPRTITPERLRDILGRQFPRPITPNHYIELGDVPDLAEIPPTVERYQIPATSSEDGAHPIDQSQYSALAWLTTSKPQSDTFVVKCFDSAKYAKPWRARSVGDQRYHDMLRVKQYCKVTQQEPEYKATEAEVIWDDNNPVFSDFEVKNHLQYIKKGHDNLLKLRAFTILYGTKQLPLGRGEVVDSFDGLSLLFYEYYDKTLKDYLKESYDNRIPPKEGFIIGHVGRSIANAVQWLHKHQDKDGPGLLHRSIRPEHVLLILNPDGKSPPIVKLGGFETITPFLADPDEEIFSKGKRRPWNAPEFPLQSSKSDVWSVGAVLYAGLTLGHAPPEQDIIKQHNLQKDELLSCYSQEARDLLSELLRTDPSKRGELAKVQSLCQNRRTGYEEELQAGWQIVEKQVNNLNVLIGRQIERLKRIFATELKNCHKVARNSRPDITRAERLLQLYNSIHTDLVADLKGQLTKNQAKKAFMRESSQEAETKVSDEVTLLCGQLVGTLAITSQQYWLYVQDHIIRASNASPQRLASSLENLAVNQQEVIDHQTGKRAAEAVKRLEPIIGDVFSRVRRSWGSPWDRLHTYRSSSLLNSRFTTYQALKQECAVWQSDKVSSDIVPESSVMLRAATLQLGILTEFHSGTCKLSHLPLDSQFEKRAGALHEEVFKKIKSSFTKWWSASGLSEEELGQAYGWLDTTRHQFNIDWARAAKYVKTQKEESTTVNSEHLYRIATRCIATVVPISTCVVEAPEEQRRPWPKKHIGVLLETIRTRAVEGNKASKKILDAEKQLQVAPPREPTPVAQPNKVSPTRKSTPTVQPQVVVPPKGPTPAAHSNVLSGARQEAPAADSRTWLEKEILEEKHGDTISKEQARASALIELFQNFLSHLCDDLYLEFWSSKPAIIDGENFLKKLKESDKRHGRLKPSSENPDYKHGKGTIAKYLPGLLLNELSKIENKSKKLFCQRIMALFHGKIWSSRVAAIIREDLQRDLMSRLEHIVKKIEETPRQSSKRKKFISYRVKQVQELNPILQKLYEGTDVAPQDIDHILSALAGQVGSYLKTVWPKGASAPATIDVTSITEKVRDRFKNDKYIDKEEHNLAERIFELDVSGSRKSNAQGLGQNQNLEKQTGTQKTTEKGKTPDKRKSPAPNAKNPLATKKSDTAEKTAESQKREEKKEKKNGKKKTQQIVQDIDDNTSFGWSDEGPPMLGDDDSNNDSNRPPIDGAGSRQSSKQPDRRSPDRSSGKKTATSSKTSPGPNKTPSTQSRHTPVENVSPLRQKKKAAPVAPLPADGPQPTCINRPVGRTLHYDPPELTFDEALKARSAANGANAEIRWPLQSTEDVKDFIEAETNRATTYLANGKLFPRSAARNHIRDVDLEAQGARRVNILSANGKQLRQLDFISAGGRAVEERISRTNSQPPSTTERRHDGNSEGSGRSRQTTPSIRKRNSNESDKENRPTKRRRTSADQPIASFSGVGNALADLSKPITTPIVNSVSSIPSGLKKAASFFITSLSGSGKTLLGESSSKPTDNGSNPWKRKASHDSRDDEDEGHKRVRWSQNELRRGSAYGSSPRDTDEPATDTKSILKTPSPRLSKNPELGNRRPSSWPQRRKSIQKPEHKLFTIVGTDELQSASHRRSIQVPEDQLFILNNGGRARSLQNINDIRCVSQPYFDSANPYLRSSMKQEAVDEQEVLIESSPEWDIYEDETAMAYDPDIYKHKTTVNNKFDVYEDEIAVDDDFDVYEDQRAMPDEDLTLPPMRGSSSNVGSHVSTERNYSREAARLTMRPPTLKELNELQESNLSDDDQFAAEDERYQEAADFERRQQQIAFSRRPPPNPVSWDRDDLPDYEELLAEQDHYHEIARELAEQAGPSRIRNSKLPGS